MSGDLLFSVVQAAHRGRLLQASHLTERSHYDSCPTREHCYFVSKVTKISRKTRVARSSIVAQLPSAPGRAHLRLLADCSCRLSATTSCENPEIVAPLDTCTSVCSLVYDMERVRLFSATSSQLSTQKRYPSVRLQYTKQMCRACQPSLRLVWVPLLTVKSDIDRHAIHDASGHLVFRKDRAWRMRSVVQRFQRGVKALASHGQPCFPSEKQ